MVPMREVDTRAQTHKGLDEDQYAETFPERPSVFLRTDGPSDELAAVPRKQSEWFSSIEELQKAGKELSGVCLALAGALDPVLTSECDNVARDPKPSPSTPMGRLLHEIIEDIHESRRFLQSILSRVAL
jgi:hypothetical protein